MKGRKPLRIILLLIIAAFVFHQVYSAVYNPITTQSAEFCTVTDGVDAGAIIVRHEKIITSSLGGTRHFKISNGSRTEKGGTIADVYNDSNASVTVSRIDELSEKIADMEEISGYNDVAATDLTLVKERANSALGDFILSCSTGDFSEASDCESALLAAENRKQYITGEAIDFAAKLEAYKSELESLKASLPSPIGSITAERSGYFVSSVDGFEETLSVNNLVELTPEKLSGLKASQAAKNVVGKIVYDYDWYLAASVSLNDSLKFKVGDELTVKTAIRNNPSLTVRVEAINASKDFDGAVVIFSCQEMNSELATARNVSITVVNEEYSGLKVNKKALRVVDGKTGVYTVSGLSAKFVQIDVIYTADKYILCKQEKGDSASALRLYDEVIVKGKNLYDGKIIS